MAKRKQSKRQNAARALPLLRALAQQQPDAVCQAEGHIKLVERYSKTYRAVVRYVGQARWSKRNFKRAEEAETYGRKLAARVCATTPAISQEETVE